MDFADQEEMEEDVEDSDELYKGAGMTAAVMLVGIDSFWGVVVWLCCGK